MGGRYELATCLHHQPFPPPTYNHAVQIHYKLNENHEWVENLRPNHSHWVQLLEKCGEKLPIKHDLPKLKIEAVRDQH